MSSLFSTFPVVLTYAIWITTGIVHLVFAGSVYADAGLLWRQRRRTTFLVGGGMWAVATLLGGVFVAGLYWLIHHSTLAPRGPVAVPPSSPHSHKV